VYCLAGVSAALATLSTHNVDSSFERFMSVFWVADHVHDQDASLMQSLDHVRWRHSDRGDKQLGLLLNHNADELIKLAMSVVVVRLPR
jgi:hypothetical protein